MGENTFRIGDKVAIKDNCEAYATLAHPFGRILTVTSLNGPFVRCDGARTGVRHERLQLVQSADVTPPPQELKTTINIVDSQFLPILALTTQGIISKENGQYILIASTTGARIPLDQPSIDKYLQYKNSQMPSELFIMD